MISSLRRRHTSARGRSAIRHAVIAAASFTLLSGLAFAPAAPAADRAGAGAEPAPSGLVTDHVVVVSIDGLRPDAIERFGATTLQRLMREGSYSLTAQTILPSRTLPSHTSMLTGVDVDVHGIDWNTNEMDDHGHVNVPTVFGLAKQQGFTTAAFFSKTKFHHLGAPNTLDHVRAPRNGWLTGQWAADRTLGYVRDYLRAADSSPNLLFVHLGEPDYAGHAYGWMGRVYGEAVRQADRAVADLLRMADARFGAGQYTVIVTADHGGHGRNHGSDDPRDTTIPWIIWGKGVRGGVELTGPVRTMDTAATALWLLGVSPPVAWVGQVVESAFPQAVLAGTPTPP